MLDKCEGCEMVVRGWLSYTECFTRVRGIRQYNSEVVKIQVAVWVYVLNMGGSEGYEHCVH